MTQYFLYFARLSSKREEMEKNVGILGRFYAIELG